MTFSDLRWPKARRSRLQLLLANLDRGVDWFSLTRQIEPHYPKAGNGRQPVPLETMIRIRVFAIVLGLNERQAEDCLIDTPALCAFARLDDNRPRPPDAETIANFRRMLDRLDIGGLIQNQLETDLIKHRVHLVFGQVTEPRWVGPRLNSDIDGEHTCEA